MWRKDGWKRKRVQVPRRVPDGLALYVGALHFGSALIGSGHRLSKHLARLERLRRTHRTRSDKGKLIAGNLTNGFWIQTCRSAKRMV